jgi:ABC-2 type transport system permease protein
MKMFPFARRCTKEIVRDPINLFFGLAFPLILLFLLSVLQKNIPVSLFQIESLAPGIAVFGLSFFTLFSASLVAKDRESAFLARLYTMPLSEFDFIFGYLLPMLPLAFLQSALLYFVSAFLGLRIHFGIFCAIIGVVPMAIFHIALGILCGSILGSKQVGSICGALLTNLSAWLSGVWFDLSLMGGFFEKLASYLPFVHAVEMEKALLKGNFSLAAGHLWPILLWILPILAASIFFFLRQMKKQ